MASDDSIPAFQNHYSLLNNLRLGINGAQVSTFSFCFWVYLPNTNSPLPLTIIQQEHPELAVGVPFLVINEKKVVLFPLVFLHKEAPAPGNHYSSLTEIACASADIDFSREKWVHVGCEVSSDFVRLHINGEAVGEKALSSLFKSDSDSNAWMRVTLVGIDGGDHRIPPGYVHNARVLPLASAIKAHYLKDPPLQLSIDSHCPEIEVGPGGIWSIVGGKASCRRNFSLNIHLLDAFGKPIDRELEVFSTLLYDDNRESVMKPNDAEAPLLISYDGTEFASHHRPSKLVHGRATFKLKISQLSSKCDNRLFCIKFYIPKAAKYPFFEVISRPIRCISRNRNPHAPSSTWKRSTFSTGPLNGFKSSRLDDSFPEVKLNNVNKAGPSPPQKRVKVGHEESATTFKTIPISERPDEECNSHSWTTNQAEITPGTSLEGRPDNIEESSDDTFTDSDSMEMRTPPSNSNKISSIINPISDSTIFNYCLGGLTEKSRLLKEFAASASDQEIADLAHQVSIFSGCFHNGTQIMMSKRLIDEGTKSWTSLTQNNEQVHWDDMVFEIEEQFMKIACCNSRSLTRQDLELLKRIAGCRDYMSLESFEKVWCWLYPVAITLSRDWINSMWSSFSPRWIEGFITKEEAEASLKGPKGLEDPGTFILRFATSRSWPHPDAGCLIVTYVGHDYIIHHRLLSLDYIYSCREREIDEKPLQDMLMEEPELSRLGRIVRSH